MQYNGSLVSCRSENGYSPMILKNSLLNYIRRGNIDASIWCSIELDNFKKCNGLPVRKTNINRLIYLTSLLINIAEPQLPYYIDKYEREWVESNNGTDDRDKMSLITMLYLIGDSEKNDCIEYLRNMYEKAPKLDYIINDPNYQLIYKNMMTIPEIAHNNWVGNINKDPISLRTLMDGFTYHLEHKNEYCYYYLFQIQNLSKERVKVGQRFRGWKPKTYQATRVLGGRFKPEYAIWEYLLGINSSVQVTKLLENPKLLRNIEILFKWFNSQTDGSVHLIAAVLYYIKTFDISKNPNMSDITSKNVEDLYQINSETHLELINKPVIDYLAADIVSDISLKIYVKIREMTQHKKTRQKNKTKPLILDTEIIDELVEDPIPD
jgi:hypothetical protein